MAAARRACEEGRGEDARMGAARHACEEGRGLGGGSVAAVYS